MAKVVWLSKSSFNKAGNRQRPSNQDLIDVTLKVYQGIKEKSELIDLVTDTSLQSLYKKEELADFWLRRRATHPSISDRALKFIMPFITSYLCEQGFSSMLYVKNKYRTKIINLDSNIRLRLKKIQPDFENLCASKQFQISH